MFILKAFGKLIKLILASILSVVVLAFDLFGWLISFIGVFVIILFAICLIVIVASGLWSTLPLLLGLFAVCVAFFFGTAYLSGGIIRLRNILLGR